MTDREMLRDIYDNLRYLKSFQDGTLSEDTYNDLTEIVHKIRWILEREKI